MTGFTLDTFVARARAAAVAPDPLAATCTLMREALASAAAAPPPAAEQDEVLLFEDATVSIWHERFRHDEILPPHDHAMVAVLGVYSGRERNDMWRRDGGIWQRGATLILEAGQLHVFAPDDIHSVQAEGGAPSLGLHIYLGALTQVDRHLFDWDTGAQVPLTDGTFKAMKRSAP